MIGESGIWAAVGELRGEMMGQRLCSLVRASGFVLVVLAALFLPESRASAQDGLIEQFGALSVFDSCPLTKDQYDIDIVREWRSYNGDPIADADQRRFMVYRKLLPSYIESRASIYEVRVDGVIKSIAEPYSKPGVAICLRIFFPTTPDTGIRLKPTRHPIGPQGLPASALAAIEERRKYCEGLKIGAIFYSILCSIWSPRGSGLGEGAPEIQKYAALDYALAFDILVGKDRFTVISFSDYYSITP